jgi:hypothetical protein
MTRRAVPQVDRREEPTVDPIYHMTYLQAVVIGLSPYLAIGFGLWLR